MLILREIETLQADQPEAIKADAVEPLLAGLASHHAGCLPAWKVLVERLFQRNLIKVVFATETLAAGINMPARSVLISALSRRRDEGIAALSHNELLQMAGRAGRRGFDDLGHCVVVQSRWEEPNTAYEIIRRGPEPLRSQFSTTYGMALNLLYYRSMKDARAFLDRSFLQYLGDAGYRRIRKDIENLRQKAEKIMESAEKRASKMAKVPSSLFASPVALDGESDGGAGNGPLNLDESDVWSRYQKLQGRRREEKRATRFLRWSLAEERGQIAESLLERSGVPNLVALDISGTNVDGKPSMLPALAVACLGDTVASVEDDEALSRLSVPSGSGRAQRKRYLCLGADNAFYAVEPRHIAAVNGGHDAVDTNRSISVEKNDDDAGGSYEQWDDIKGKVLDHASKIRRSAWRELSSTCAVAEGSLLTARIAATELSRSEDFAMLQPSEEGLEALQTQRERLAHVRKEIQALRANGKVAQAWKRYEKDSGKANDLLKRADDLEKELEGGLDGGWKSFEAIVDVLEAAGAVEPEASALSDAGEEGKRTPGANVEEPTESGFGAMHDGRVMKFTPLGLVARDLRCSNELWMAAAMSHPALQGLNPPQLAGVMSALVASEAFSRSAVHVAYPPSYTVAETIESMESVRSDIARLQFQVGLDVPLLVDLRLAGLVEAWASGASWQEITEDCSLDDGDVARLLMRTTDALRQLMHCEHLLPETRTAARLANRAMNRIPISDLIA